MTETTAVKVGDIFVESWGYDQTNVDAYQVVRRTAATVFLKPVGLETVDGRVRPVRDSYLVDDWARIGKPNRHGEVAKRLIVDWKGQPSVTLSSYSTGRLWNGADTFHETHAAGGAGH